MNRAWWLVLATISVALMGCPRAETCLPGDEPTLEIGTGENRYTSLDDVDDVLDIVHGPQGGYHVVIALEASYLDASDLMLGQLTGTIGGEEKASSAPWIQMRCNPNRDMLQSWNHLLIWDVEDPAEIDGERATISATVTDSLGATVSAEAEADLYDPELH